MALESTLGVLCIALNTLNFQDDVFGLAISEQNAVLRSHLLEIVLKR